VGVGVARRTTMTPGRGRGRGNLRQYCEWQYGYILKPHTHSTEDTGHLCNEIELSLSRDHTRPFDCLERYRPEPIVHQSQARVVVVGLVNVANDKAFLSQRASVGREWRLDSIFSFWQ